MYSKILTLLILAATVPRCCPAVEPRPRIVASTLYFECRGESREGQLAVASVIWNRSRRQGITPEEVCLAPKQFSCNTGGVKVPQPENWKDRKALELFETIEVQMLLGIFQPTTDADHFYNPTLCNPVWGRYMKNKQKMGNHLFGNCR